MLNLPFYEVGKYYSWLNTAVTILNQYSGQQPFAAFIKTFFSTDKKYGSKDRRQISHLCYCYFRLGKMVPSGAPNTTNAQEYILAGLLLCSNQPNEMLGAVKPDWNACCTAGMQQKLDLIQQTVTGLQGLDQVFPWKTALSPGIAISDFTSSFFNQPQLFLRIRPGNYDRVLHQLEDAGWHYRVMDKETVAVTNQTKLEERLHINRQVVIQDYSSQQVAQLLRLVPQKRALKVWDCCAASGGKSILATDVLGNIDLTVSDIRESILVNLKKRLKEAGIHQYRSFTADLTQPTAIPTHNAFDLVICDAPCSGSGTWARTPEQLFYFKEEEIDLFQVLQQKIVQNILPCVKKGGYFLYITCSVFERENEAQARFIEAAGLYMVKMNLLQGAVFKADTMFAALFRKP